MIELAVQARCFGKLSMTFYYFSDILLVLATDMHHFKELKVWQRSMDAAHTAYELCSLFPDAERYGLTSQMRQAAISIPSNISEGAGRSSKAEFRHFLSIAAGSAYELETQFLLAERFQYLKPEQVAAMLNELAEIQRMTYGLRNNLRD